MKSRKQYKILLNFIIFVFLLFFIYSINVLGEPGNIKINEIMYNPIQNDNYNEWIEIYNPTSQQINISGWTITDNKAEDTIEPDNDHYNGSTIISGFGYGIIADHGSKIYENFSINDNTLLLYIDDLSIGNGLGNSKDKLILKNQYGEIIDTVEWGNDYPDIPGEPAYIVEEGHALARYPNIDTNNSSYDFFDSKIPTPGDKNQNLPETHPQLKIKLYPRYISKVEKKSKYSPPFGIKINIIDYPPLEEIQLKTYVIGNLSSSSPASQTWDETSWKYSNYYTHNIKTDENGNWSKWIFLRVNKDYKEYKNHIEDSSKAYVFVKTKYENSTEETFIESFLLDMDNSTENDIDGGYALGVASNEKSVFENKIVMIENKTGVITGIYKTENNLIDDGSVSHPGYYKITSPLNDNYKIKIYDNNGFLIHSIQNISIFQGSYGLKINNRKIDYMVKRNKDLDIPISIKNIGDFPDKIKVEAIGYQKDWNITLEDQLIFLNPGESSKINLHIKPCKYQMCTSTYLTVKVTSLKDIGQSDEITFNIEIQAPDLIIKKIKLYDENDILNNTYGEGETVRIKSFLKNIGNDAAKEVMVEFYYDKEDFEHLIGSKRYDSVSKYQKYPSVKWDTAGISPGKHEIIIIVDKQNTIEELDEQNNKFTIDINITNTKPNSSAMNIIISELYYHSRSKINNEYITIYNPTSETLNISRWYLTNQPMKNRYLQTKIIFPNNTKIPPLNKIIVTQNASAYEWETSKKPDFEYKSDSDVKIPQMNSFKTLTLSNNGGAIALKDSYNHTIDITLYGEINKNITGWNGSTIPNSGSGIILKRNKKDSLFIDTNSSKDWILSRRYQIGQSDFPYQKLFVNGEIKTFVSPDCSYKTIINELRNANSSIYFNIYEFTNPFLGNGLINALKRNVSVFIFLEGSPIGGIDDREQHILNKIHSYGGHIRFIVNDKNNKVYARYPFDHGKYLIIDNETVIVESCNWVKTGVPIDPSFGNREWGIVVKNKEIAEYFISVFKDDYNPSRCDSYSFIEMNFSIQPDYYPDDTIYKGEYKPEFESLNISGNFSAIPVFSPDNSEIAICDMIDSAKNSIYIQQLYIYRDWKNKISPFVERLVNKSQNGVDVRVIMNFNPCYKPSNDKCNETKAYLEENGAKVKFVFTNWSYFTNVHNKGMIIDNRSVLISSINWNENSVRRNREAGIIITHKSIAEFYADVFLYDWNLSQPIQKNNTIIENIIFDENSIYITLIFTMTFVLVARDWRKRQWT